MSSLSVLAKKYGITEEGIENLIRLLGENENIPFNIEEKRNKIISSWSENKILEDENNSIQFEPESTIEKISLVDAGNSINLFFVDKISLNILDIMSGNGIASDYIFEILEPKIGRWISTDVIDFKKPKLNKKHFYKLNTVDSVEKYGMVSNVLLIISPTPGESYADYFACKDFIEQTKYHEKKYIIFIGELGGGDGSKGMYKYLLKHPKLNLHVEKEISRYTYNYGFTAIKKLYIFEIKNEDSLRNDFTNNKSTILFFYFVLICIFLILLYMSYRHLFLF